VAPTPVTAPAKEMPKPAAFNPYAQTPFQPVGYTPNYFPAYPQPMYMPGNYYGNAGGFSFGR
jgi:hypothetical protein